MASMDSLTQLKLLKSMTERTGSLHEAQVLQLKMWPLLIIGATKKTVVHVDQDDHLFKVMLDVDQSFNESDPVTAQLMREIVGWARHITWDDMHGIFIANHRTIYDSRTERRDSGSGAPASGTSGT